MPPLLSFLRLRNFGGKHKLKKLGIDELLLLERKERELNVMRSLFRLGRSKTKELAFLHLRLGIGFPALKPSIFSLGWEFYMQ